MPGIPFSALVDSFIKVLERAGATVFPLDMTISRRPARLRVITVSKVTSCILFLWTITPGGGGPNVRPLKERRIQITNVRKIPLEPGCRTLLGGWSQEFGVYCFWDARRHVTFSERSPSLQVSSDTLEAAATKGIAAYLRRAATGQEVAIAVAPDSLLWYVENGLSLHNADEDAQEVSNLAMACSAEERSFLDSSKNDIQAARRYDLVQTMRAYRDARFQPAVLRAYRYRCAVCGWAMKLVDAAHIIPVSCPESTDEVTNGLALCRLHHAAYDNGLLGVQSDYSIAINPQYLERLKSLKLEDGFEEFKSSLPDKIIVPVEREVRPSPKNLIIGLRARHWPEELIK